MALEIPKTSYTGKINEVSLGKGDKAVTVGGESVYPFYLFEGEMPQLPRIAMEVWDCEPDDWPAAALEPFAGVANDPVAWAKKCIDDYGAEMITLFLQSTDPNGLDRSAEEAAAVVKKVADAIDVLWLGDERFRAVSHGSRAAAACLWNPSVRARSRFGLYPAGVAIENLGSGIRRQHSGLRRNPLAAHSRAVRAAAVHPCEAWPLSEVRVPDGGLRRLHRVREAVAQARRGLTNRSSCQAARRAAGRDLLAAPPSAALRSPQPYHACVSGPSSSTARS